MNFLNLYLKNSYYKAIIAQFACWNCEVVSMEVGICFEKAVGTRTTQQLKTATLRYVAFTVDGYAIQKD